MESGIKMVKKAYWKMELLREVVEFKNQLNMGNIQGVSKIVPTRLRSEVFSLESLSIWFDRFMVSNCTLAKL